MNTTPNLRDWLDKWLATPAGASRGTDAPGTNSRRDVATPERSEGTTVHGRPGSHPDTLGYPVQGDALYPRMDSALRDAQTKALRDQAVLRYPRLATHGRPGPAVPEYNQLYSQLRDRDAYTMTISNTAHGSWVVGTTTKQTVTLDAPAKLLLSQFPGAIGVYPTLLLWTFAQSVTTATGEYSMAWELLGGDLQFPLGEYNAGDANALEYPRWVVPMLITDANPTTLGSIIITSNGVTGTPTIFWRMGIGWAYLLPAPAGKGYAPMEAGAAWNS